jgi:hypothetical protein
MITFIFLLICSGIGAAIGHFVEHTTHAVVVGAIIGFVVGCALRWANAEGADTAACLCDIDFDND